MSPYGAAITNFQTVLSELKTKLQAHITTYGADKVAVYFASFDEGVSLMAQASADPVFSSVKWYGGDGIVLSAALPAKRLRRFI